MGPGRVSGFFETGQPLPTNISSVKVTKTFTDEIFVGKGYSYVCTRDIRTVYIRNTHVLLHILFFLQKQKKLMELS